MKERGLIFGGPMVRAILAGMKTQTRRLTKEPFTEDQPYGRPYASVGDRRWVRESWARGGRHGKVLDGEASPIPFRYAADQVDNSPIEPLYASPFGGWKPERWISPILMPRSASRIDLEVTEVRLQRLHDITKDDIRAEGVGWGTMIDHYLPGLWRSGWDAINAKRAPWASNPFVWAVSFRRVRP